jgi:hypothetical protein
MNTNYLLAVVNKVISFLNEIEGRFHINNNVLNKNIFSDEDEYIFGTNFSLDTLNIST